MLPGDPISAVATVKELGPPLVVYASPVGEDLLVGDRAEVIRRKRKTGRTGLLGTVAFALASVGLGAVFAFGRDR